MPKRTTLPSRPQAGRLPEPGLRQKFRRELLDWYDRNGRDLPWRETDDPYHILVSEVMLQQTQVDRVLPKYEEWLEKYPSFDALAATPEDEVVKTWYPLGYNIRPRRLHAIAREAVVNYGGELPSDPATLLSFKGIGPYTAGAVLSFAFKQRAAILDTNIARVLFRIFVSRGDSTTHRIKKHLWSLADITMPHKRVFDFNQALMDFGAMVCVARKPKCSECTMSSMCRSYPFSPARDARAKMRLK
ncbi:MAG: A/G-specific adenine glycosylase [Acidobacteria bacterium]|nr:A/G-specific adenine glycosylase [Acidobacteriota bacterium]